MKDYLLFMGEKYEAHGGWDDYQGEFFTVAEALKWVDEHKEDWAIQWFHVVSWSERCIIERGRLNYNCVSDSRSVEMEDENG